MDKNDLNPSNPLERIFSKLTLAQQSNNSIQRAAHEKLDSIQRQQEKLERKLDSLVELVQSTNSTTRIVIERVATVHELGRNSFAEIKEIRRVFTESSKTLALVGKDISEARDDIEEVKETTGKRPLYDENEEEGLSKRGFFLSWSTIGGSIKRHWPHLLTSGGAIAIYQAIKALLHP